VDKGNLKHRILVDQLVLDFWLGKKIDSKKHKADNGDTKERARYLKHTFDVTDALLISFIEDLNPQDKDVRKIMYRGHFMLTLTYVKERLPLLQLKERGIYRRLRWLKMMGILSCVHKTVDGNKTLAYYKCSDLYFKIKAKRHAIAAKAATEAKEEAIAPVDHGSEEAIAPVDLSHSPQGPRSLSNIGNITPPVAASADALSEGAPPVGSPAERYPEVGEGLYKLVRSFDKRNREKVTATAGGIP